MPQTKYIVSLDQHRVHREMQQAVMILERNRDAVCTILGSQDNNPAVKALRLAALHEMRNVMREVSLWSSSAYENDRAVYEERTIPPACDRTITENLALDHLTWQGVALTPEIYDAIKVLFSPVLQNPEEPTALEARTVLAAELAATAVLVAKDVPGQRVRFAPTIIETLADSAQELACIFEGCEHA